MSDCERSRNSAGDGFCDRATAARPARNRPTAANRRMDVRCMCRLPSKSDTADELPFRVPQAVVLTASADEIETSRQAAWISASIVLVGSFHQRPRLFGPTRLGP